jgi:hypothetical protein
LALVQRVCGAGVFGTSGLRRLSEKGFSTNRKSTVEPAHVIAKPAGQIACCY